MSLSKKQLAAGYEAHYHWGVNWPTVAEISGNSFSVFMQLKRSLEKNNPTVANKPCIDKSELEQNPVNAFLMSKSL